MNAEFFQELGEDEKRGHVAKEKTMKTIYLYIHMFSASYKHHLIQHIATCVRCRRWWGAGVDKYIKRQRARDSWTALTSEHTPISAAQITHYAFSLPLSLDCMGRGCCRCCRCRCSQRTCSECLWFAERSLCNARVLHRRREATGSPWLPAKAPAISSVERGGGGVVGTVCSQTK